MCISIGFGLGPLILKSFLGQLFGDVFACVQTSPRLSGIICGMKALSVRQPWASLIASGEKTIEVRSRRTHYRGPLLICASRFVGTAPRDLPRGVALCIVDLVDCRSFDRSDCNAARFPGTDTDFAWVLNNCRRIEHFAVLGRLGLFDVELPRNVFRAYHCSAG